MKKGAGEGDRLLGCPRPHLWYLLSWLASSKVPTFGWIKNY